MGGAGGLQVMNTCGEYVDAKPVPNSVIINIGDCLQFQTQERLKSTKHRVLVPEESASVIRRSLAFFVHQDDDVVVNQPLRYGPDPEITRPVDEPITALQWLLKKFDA